MNKTSERIWFQNTIFLQKKTKLLGEIVDSKYSLGIYKIWEILHWSAQKVMETCPKMQKPARWAPIGQGESESHSVVSYSLWPHGLYRVHGILQAILLEWVAFPFSRGSSQPKDQSQISRITGRFFTSCAIKEAPHWSNHLKFEHQKE